MANTLYQVTRGIVLRETETKEADKILTVLSADLGKISVIARGARRKGCKFTACAQTLVWSEMTLYHRGDWYYLNEGSTLRLFDGLRTDLEKLALGFYFAELTEAVTQEEVAGPELLSLLLNGLYALESLDRPLALIKAAFELRLMSLAGYEPLADACACCGLAEPEEPRLDVRQGIVHCRRCGVNGEGLSMPLCRSSLAALRHAVYGDPKRLYAFTLGPEALARLSDAAEAFVLTQMERGFRTLDYYKSVQM